MAALVRRPSQTGEMNTDMNTQNTNQTPTHNPQPQGRTHRPPRAGTGNGRPLASRLLSRMTALALVLLILGAGAGSAWSVDGQALYGSPRLEHFGTARAAARTNGTADPCRALLEPVTQPQTAQNTARSGLRTAVSLPEGRRAAHLAMFGMMLGARYATGPREMRANTTASDSAAVAAVTAYRQCRAEYALESLSN